MPDNYFDEYNMPGRKENPYRGWEIYEKGIYDICTNIRTEYGNIPFFISENGMGVENEQKLFDHLILNFYNILLLFHLLMQYGRQLLISLKTI